jgi:signal-induced proliferation-associated 1 like protein 3
MPLDPDRPVPLAPVLPLMPLVPEEPEPMLPLVPVPVLLPEVPLPMVPVPVVPVPEVPEVPVPMLPLAPVPVPMLPDEPDVPCISWLPLDDEPLLPVEPALLEPWLELLWWCDFFLLCFLVEELPDAPDD